MRDLFFITPARLKFRAEVEAEKFSEQSVEGRAFAKPIQLTTGYGFLCHFTDPKLVGKAEKKGDFKTISTGLIHVSASILIEVVQGDFLDRKAEWPAVVQQYTWGSKVTAGGRYLLDARKIPASVKKKKVMILAVTTWAAKTT